MYKTIFLLVCIASFAKFTLSVNDCKIHSSCHDCIQTPNCFWNLKERVPDGSRCLSFTSAKLQKVDESKLYNPANMMRIIKSEPLSETVFISPQKIYMRLRLGSPFAFNVESKEPDDTFEVPSLGTTSQFLHVSTENTKVKIQVVKCPQDPSQSDQQIDIMSSKTNQSVSVKVRLLCSCSCEKDAVENADECHGHGTYKCGVCHCNTGKFGSTCECEGDSNPAGCLTPQSNAVCSNRGSCICGVCACKMRDNPDEKITGKYCECDNFSCDRLEGKLCGGPERGECMCGQCACKLGWTGGNCSTPLAVN
ncbi:integrin beta-PS-like [Tenebrio molitor]|uniref:integrin beta-PS-like n=1 Tax=Tenebrio molitor TaxID=7067 RepID=UPI00362487D3